MDNAWATMHQNNQLFTCLRSVTRSSDKPAKLKSMAGFFVRAPSYTQRSTMRKRVTPPLSEHEALASVDCALTEHDASASERADLRPLGITRLRFVLQQNITRSRFVLRQNPLAYASCSDRPTRWRFVL